MYYMKKKKGEGSTRKSLPSLIKRLDKEFSLYIRMRDSRPYGFTAFKCISCGRIKPFDQADCGHYYSRTKMSTRFDEENCHAECRWCNRFSADHLDYYRENLIKKIGSAKFELLRLRSLSTKKWSAFELEYLIKYYKQLNKQFNKANETETNTLAKGAQP